MMCSSVPRVPKRGNSGAGRLADAEHPAIDMGGNARPQIPRWLARPRWLVPADRFVIATDAACGDQRGLRTELEFGGHGA